MCPAAILAPSNAGKTTILTMLKDAALEYNQEHLQWEDKEKGLEQPRDFAFREDNLAQRILIEYHTDLIKGKLPRHQESEEKYQLNTSYGFRRVWTKYFEGVITRAKFIYRVVRFSTWDIAGEDVSAFVRDYVEHDGKPGDDEKGMEEILRCNVIVFVIDGDVLEESDTPVDKNFQRKLDYDSHMTSLIRAIGTFREKRKLRGEVYPIMVIHKLDKLKAIIPTLQVPPDLRPATYPPPGPVIGKPNEKKVERVRKAYSEALLARFLPNFHAALAGEELGKLGLRFDQYKVFFSYLQMDSSKLGADPHPIFRQTKTGRNSFEYSEDEYRGILEYLGSLADKVGEYEHTNKLAKA